MVEVFKQPAFSPKPIEVQVSILWAVQNAYFDDIEVAKIQEATEGLQEFMSTRKVDLLTSIRTEAKLTDEITESLKGAVEEWKRTFA